MDFDKVDPKTQFNMLLRKKQELDAALTDRQSTVKGTLDFVSYRLDKERKKVKEDLARLSFRFTPDTIA
ncbi:MAG: hypothetical protein HEEMFOPI_01783 [Holosporales bacterium]